MAIETDQARQTGSILGYQAKFVDVDGIRTRYFDLGSVGPKSRCSASSRAYTSAGTAEPRSALGGIPRRGSPQSERPIRRRRPRDQSHRAREHGVGLPGLPGG